MPPPSTTCTFPVFGNPNLQPEKGTSWEVGADYKVGAQRFSATYFDSNITDLIVFDSTTFAPDERGRSTHPRPRARL